MPKSKSKGIFKMNNVRITGNMNKTNIGRVVIEWLKTKQKLKS